MDLLFNIRSVVYKFLNTVVKTFLELFIVNKKLRRALKGKFCKWFLKNYIKEIDSMPVEFSKSEDKKYRIWQYWEQGTENAPPIVKACLNSVKRNRGNLERVIITFDTIKDYIQLPDYVYELKSKGIISSAHFADILRTYLLYEHGGCWIDATVYLTGALPEFIQESELFVLQNNKDEDPDGLNMTNYFMSSKGKSILISKMKNFLDLYWSKNHFVINYFFYMHTFTLFTASSDEAQKEWNIMHPFSYITVQQMEEEVLNEYSEARLNELSEQSCMHKLSYKWKVLSKKKKASIDGTLLEHIIKSNLD